MATTKPEKQGTVAKFPGGILGCGCYFGGLVGRVDFFLVLLLRVCKSSTSGSSDTTISTPRLIVVELRAIVLLWGRIVFGYYTAPSDKRRVAVQILPARESSRD